MIILIYISDDAIVQPRVMETTWKKATSLVDTLQLRYNQQHESTNQIPILYPLPITITFSPKTNQYYQSRYRITCEYGNSFDFILKGKGTYEDYEHFPLTPIPK